MDGIDTATRAPGGGADAASSLLNELSGMFDDLPAKPVADAPVEASIPPPPEESVAEVQPAVAQPMAIPPVSSDPIIWKPSRRSFLRLRR